MAYKMTIYHGNFVPWTNHLDGRKTVKTIKEEAKVIMKLAMKTKEAEVSIWDKDGVCLVDREKLVLE